MNHESPSSGFQPPSPVEGEGKIKCLAKILRKNQQRPEQILWYYLRNRRFQGYKFRRQVQIGNYIVDFVCYDIRLIVELDGRQHLTPDNLRHDEERTKYLESQDFKVIRFYNTDVLNNIESVLEDLYQVVEKQAREILLPRRESGFADGRRSEVASPDSENIELAEPKVRKRDYSSEEQIQDKVTGGRMRVEKMTILNKQELRKWAKEERKKLNLEELSQKLVEKLQTTEEYRQAKNIMIFYPLKDEINLLTLLKDKTKNFYLPKIDGENLLCCPYGDGDALCESCFKTKEPLTEPIEKQLIDLVIVPALAVDEDNYRLGYGGGFYDRFLAGVNVTKITCLPEKLLVTTVYPQDYDIKNDKIILA